MNKFYVYSHRINGIPFYVGKGHGRRAYSRNNRNKAWHQIAQDELDVVFERVGLTEEEAFQIEKDMIRFYRSRGRQLVNKTSGGQGMSGFSLSQESRYKISKKLTGMKQSDRTIEKRRATFASMHDKLSEAHRNPSPEVRLKMSIAQTGKKQSDETRQKRSSSLLGRKRPPHVVEAISKAHSKPVLCLDTGMIYDSATSASDALKIQRENIGNVCRGKRKTAGGFRFIFHKEDQ